MQNLAEILRGTLGKVVKTIRQKTEVLPNRASSESDKPTVLVVDDYPPFVGYLCYLLRKMDVKPIYATSGEQAIEIMKKRSVDGMLLDINLGSEISGISLMERFRGQTRFERTPIIAMTAFTGEYPSYNMFAKGFTDYVPKPLGLPEIKEIVVKHVSVSTTYAL